MNVFKTARFAQIVRKAIRKVVKVSAFKVLSDLTYTAVMFGLTGNVSLTLTSLSATKVVSAFAYAAYDEYKFRSVWMKALGWEALITMIGTTINWLLTGRISIALQITLAMKVFIPIHAAYEKLWRRWNR